MVFRLVGKGKSRPKQVVSWKIISSKLKMEKNIECLGIFHEMQPNKPRETNLIAVNTDLGNVWYELKPRIPIGVVSIYKALQ